MLSAVYLPCIPPASRLHLGGISAGKHIAYLRWTAVELLARSKKKIDDKDFTLYRDSELLGLMVG